MALLICHGCVQAHPLTNIPAPTCIRNGSPYSSSSSSTKGFANPTSFQQQGFLCTSQPRIQASSLFSFLTSKKDVSLLKTELLDAIAPLDRGAEATPDDEFRVEQIAKDLESVNPTKEPLKSSLINGKWELLYTTSKSVLQKQRPKIFRPNGRIYQAINVDTLRAQNMETWPYFNQVTANLTPLNRRKVAVQFDKFKVFGLISIKAPQQARGELEITFLDDELRISRGDKGNIFILQMVDRSYRVPMS